jgi:peroxiredoxin
MKFSYYLSIAILFTFVSSASLRAQTVASAVEKVRSPEVGTTIPEVSLIDIKGTTTSLSNLINGKKAIIVLYRGGWCPYCTAQMSGLAKVKDEVIAMGYQIIGITGEDVVQTSKFSKDKDLPYKIYTDNGLMLAKKLGVAYQVDNETIKKYNGYGISIAEGVLPVPTLLVVNETGKLSYVYSNPDYTVRLTSEELVSVLKSQKIIDTE